MHGSLNTITDEAITSLRWRTTQHEILGKPRLLKQSATTGHTLICSQAVTCLPRKNLWANVASQCGLSGPSGSGLYITSDYYKILCYLWYYALFDVVGGLRAVRNRIENLL